MKQGAHGVVCLWLLVCAGVMVGRTGADPIVHTSYGPVQGKTMDSGAWGFLGVPYAAPPVGDLRFSAPTAPVPWNATLATQSYAPGCPQPKVPVFGPDGPFSEDCLYVNVFTPPGVNSTSGLDVMVFIHGGGYVTGATSAYPGDAIAMHGDVVVVTLSYRLGVLGFIILQDTRDNAGLADQRFALEWIQKNIGQFGGDASKVTLFGQSAGGGSIVFHMLTRSTQGLYARAILESPGAWQYPTCLDSAANGQEVARHFNCTSLSTQAECLRRVDVDTLLTATATLPMFVPCVGTGEFPHQPLSLLLKGKTAVEVPLLIGNVAAEGNLDAFLITQSLPNGTVSESDYNMYMREVFTMLPYELVISMYAQYAQQHGYWMTIAQSVGDYWIECGNDLAANLVWSSSTNTQPIYRYQFVHAPDEWAYASTLGATHLTELPFVFGYAGAGGVRFPAFSGSAETTLVNHVMDAWLAFASGGSPVLPSGDAWPTFGGANTSTIVEINDVNQWSLISYENAFCAKWKPILTS